MSKTRDELWIPCCMGTAAACGCGKSLSEIKSHCTCPPKSQKKALDIDEITRRIEGCEQQVAELMEQLTEAKQ